MEIPVKYRLDTGNKSFNCTYTDNRISRPPVNGRISQSQALLDPGTICMHKILTHKTLIFVSHGPNGMRIIWAITLNLRDFFLLAIF